MNEPGPETSVPAEPDAEAPPRPTRRRLQERIPDGALHSADAILDRFLGWIDRSGITPYAAQEEALLELATGRHVVLSTPTGSGKSLVALGLHFKAMCEGKRSFYTAPIKALVSEKFFALCDELGAENVGMLTGDASINWGAPVICCTAEVLANMAVRQGRKLDAPYVVMDEFHYYDDPDRGMAWQLPLLTLPNTTFLLMSATLGNTAGIEERLRQYSGRDVAHVHSDERPVPLDFEYSEVSLHTTVEKLLESRRAPIYVVNFTQRDAADRAQALTSAQVGSREDRRAIADAIGGFRFDSPYGKDLKRILGHGIGLHHAGLLPKYRLLVEQLAQRGLLRVICGTDTLGVGVNVPIRTVLFTQLSKFDGERVRLLSVREFKQIAGRAGRKGFDDSGSVVCQAPEHVIDNLRLDEKTAAKGKGGKKPVKKKPPKNFVAWGRDTFEGLTERPPEALESRFAVSHGLLISCLQRENEGGEPGSGYRRLLEVIERCHEPETRKPGLRREAALLFRSLRRAGIIVLEPNALPKRPGVRVADELQSDFSLHQTLSLYLVDAIAALDRAHPDYALDLLSCVEAILENPRPILFQQQRQARDALFARLKAEGVEYDERIEKVQQLSWPQPNEEFFRETFALFAAAHPWVRDDSLKPKSVARELVESMGSFDEYVRSGGHARVEGVLLRYLSQVHNTLAHGVPDAAKTDEVFEIAGALRAMLARVDSSLVEEWESLVSPSAASDAAPAPGLALRERAHRDPAADPKAFRARIRGELHQLLHALAREDYEEAAACLRADADEAWTPERLARELAPFLEEHGTVNDTPRAREAQRTHFGERIDRVWDVQQALVDESGEDLWALHCEIDLREAVPEGPLIQLLRVAP